MKLFKKRWTSEKSIREACNNLPIGICLSGTISGIPRLTNFRMQELAGMITGNHLANAIVFWNDLETFDKNAKAKKISFTETPTVELITGEIINFTKQELEIKGGKYTEILATDVTEQYKVSLQIAAENDHLRMKTAQLNELMKNIASLNRDEEVLESKMRVHYELGRVVLASRQFLADHGEATGKEELLEMWDDVLKGFENPLFSEKTSFDLLAELRSMAENNGCELKFEGNVDAENELVVEIIREGLVNAVRHGKATEVSVVTQTKQVSEHTRRCNIMIVDNGEGFDKAEMRQGGLSSLESKLKENGGELSLYNRAVANGAILEANFILKNK